ncbi:hypothetical protein [Paenibacillus elgii]|uniref:hypothetical protein n=1 Tax=Paenibacillus elgii TaxID=189691 RepID=UPI000FD68A53|nr:hypothetical protein [Paenibacillus elgii]NEN81043.1 hypothetical protein [Paenibacillus elgii]
MQEIPITIVAEAYASPAVKTMRKNWSQEKPSLALTDLHLHASSTQAAATKPIRGGGITPLLFLLLQERGKLPCKLN